MKRAFTYILILLLLAATAGKSLLYFNYLLQKSYIAANLCENRDKPVLDCEGKCYLNKVVNEAEEQEKNINLNLELETGVVPDSSLEYLFDTSLSSLVLTRYSLVQTNPHAGFLSDIFQPPV